ncbi:HNH endonuclease signature motif containing protein, partial [Microbacterium sp. AGC85]
GPVDPATARILVGNAPGFDRVFTHPASGMVLGVDRYRPSSEMRRYLRARDRRCRFPGCRLVARLCDDDHTIDHAHGGATTVANLADFCRRHHVTKHQTPWKVRQLGGGVLEWTSPTGRIYVDRPPGVATYVTFDDVADRMPSKAPF